MKQYGQLIFGDGTARIDILNGQLNINLTQEWWTLSQDETIELRDWLNEELDYTVPEDRWCSCGTHLTIVGDGPCANGGV